MHKDKLGQKLVLGDDIIYIKPNYRSLSIGKILRFTTKMLILSKERLKPATNAELKQFPDQVVKITIQDK